MPKRMITRLASLLLFILLLVPSTAFACSCGPTTVERQLQNVDAIFTGRVVSIRDDVQLPETGRFVTLEVARTYKGGQTGQVVVKTGFNTADCGVPFREGTQWLVYANAQEQGLLSASSCNLTKELSQAHSDLVTLGAERESSSPTPSSSPYLLGGLLVLLAALIWFVRRSWGKGNRP